MMDLLPQISLFGVLFLFLAIGLFYKNKPRTIKEYALGKKKVSTATLIATMIATTMGGGSIIGQSSDLYQYGMWFFLASCAMPLGSCIMSLVIVPKLSKYYGCFSIAEVIGRMYGTYARKLMGITALIFCLGVLAGQIKALHWVMEHVFTQNSILATIVALSVIILYSSIGGVSSVIRTDVVQVFIFMVIIPAIARHMISMSGGITQIVESIPKDKATFFPAGGIMGVISLAIFYMLPDVAPDSFHRFLIGRDRKKNQSAAYALAFVDLLNLIFVSCVAFIAISKFSSIKPQDVIFIVVQSFIKVKWLFMLFIIALIAIIVSTADSAINTSSVILMHDILDKKITESQKIKLLRIITVLFGVIAFFLTFLFASILDIVLFFSEYYAIICSTPFIAGLFLKELRKEPFWISTFTGVSVFSILHLIYLNLAHEIFLASFIAGLCAYFITFFIVKEHALQIGNFSLRKKCNSIVKNFSIQSTTLAYTILSFFLLSIFFKNKYIHQSKMTFDMEIIIGVLGVLLFFVDRVSIRYRNIIIISALWYCFSFFPTYSFLQQKTGTFFTVSFVTSMFLLSVLLSWDVLLTFLLSGSLVASTVFCFVTRKLVFSVAPLMHLGLFITCTATIIYVFLRTQEKRVFKFSKDMSGLRRYDDKLAFKERDVARETLRSVDKSINAHLKYQHTLLHEHDATEICFAELKSDILDYFKQIGIERNIKLDICSINRKKLDVQMPLNIFYKIVYSLIFNILYCVKDKEVVVKFCRDQHNKVKGIEVYCKGGKIQDKLKYLMNCPITYSKHILRWTDVEILLEKLEAKIIEKNENFQISFSPTWKQTHDHVVCFKNMQREIIFQNDN